MKLVIISLDLLLALPVLTLGVTLLFSSVNDSQLRLLSLAEAHNRTLDLLTASQQIAVKVDSGAYNFSSAYAAAAELASSSGLKAEITQLNHTAACAEPFSQCRIVTIGGMAYLLVLSHENTS